MDTTTDRTTRQLMFSLIEVWKSSGKTQKEFCQGKGLPYHKFHYWFKKYNHQNSPASDQPAFVQVPAHGKARSAVELVYPDGRRLIFHQSVEASFLRSLLA